MRVGGRESSRFEVKKGVRQGCSLSPWLFNHILTGGAIYSRYISYIYVATVLVHSTL